MSRFIDLFDVRVPMRTLLTLVFVAGSVVIGGARLEGVMIREYDDIKNQIALEADAIKAQGLQLNTIRDTITQTNTRHDAQIEQIQMQFNNVTGKADQDRDATKAAIGEINVRLSNITRDIAVMKCRMGKC